MGRLGPKCGSFLVGSSLSCEPLSLGNNLVNVANHVEGTLGQVVVLASKDILEAGDGLGNGDKLARVVGEHLSDLEGLRQEPLNFPRPGDLDLVLLRQLIHTQDSNDILERLVVLQQLLDITGNSVVLSSDDIGVHDTGGGVEGVDSGHVDGLHRCDGSLLGSGDTLLHGTHVSGQSGLVTDSRGDTTEQGRHLRTSLGEPEDVVDEEQHVLALLVAEVLGNSQSGEGNTGTGARGLVHLSVHQGDLGGLVLQRDDTTLNHLVVQIVALPGPLADTGEHGETTVSLGNVVDQLHDKHSLADTGAAEETDLTSLAVRGEQVDDLDTSDKDLLLDRHLVEVGSLSVDGLALVSGDGAPLVDRVSDHVDDAAKGLLTHGDGDGKTLILDNVASDETLGTVHGNGPDGVLSKVLGDLKNELGLPADDSEGVEDLREAIVELDVHNGTDDGHNLALLSFDGRAHGELALVGNGGQSLGDIAGDGLPDEPGGGASCGAQHDVRGSELLAHGLGTARVGLGLGCGRNSIA